MVQSLQTTWAHRRSLEPGEGGQRGALLPHLPLCPDSHAGGCLADPAPRRHALPHPGQMLHPLPSQKSGLSTPRGGVWWNRLTPTWRAVRAELRTSPRCPSSALTGEPSSLTHTHADIVLTTSDRGVFQTAPHVPGERGSSRRWSGVSPHRWTAA